MPGLLQLLWLAAFVQVGIAFANLFLPAKLKYRENLSRVAPIIRQIFVVHSIYIVGRCASLRRRHVRFRRRIGQRPWPGAFPRHGHGLVLALSRPGSAPLLRCHSAPGKSLGRHRLHRRRTLPRRDLWRSLLHAGLVSYRDAPSPNSLSSGGNDGCGRRRNLAPRPLPDHPALPVQHF